MGRVARMKKIINTLIHTLTKAIGALVEFGSSK
jgi:hypothetical protein